MASINDWWETTKKGNEKGKGLWGVECILAVAIGTGGPVLTVNSTAAASRPTGTVRKKAEGEGGVRGSVGIRMMGQSDAGRVGRFA
eukprot:646480-Prorocentrum_minimum.AAC.3